MILLSLLMGAGREDARLLPPRISDIAFQPLPAKGHHLSLYASNVCAPVKVGENRVDRDRRVRRWVCGGQAAARHARAAEAAGYV